MTERSSFLHVNLGHILTIVSILITLFIYHEKVMSRIAIMETKLDLMYGWFSKEVIDRPLREVDLLKKIDIKIEESKATPKASLSEGKK